MAFNKSLAFERPKNWGKCVKKISDCEERNKRRVSLRQKETSGADFRENKRIESELNQVVGECGHLTCLASRKLASIKVNSSFVVTFLDFRLLH